MEPMQRKFIVANRRELHKLKKAIKKFESRYQIIGIGTYLIEYIKQSNDIRENDPPLVEIRGEKNLHIYSRIYEVIDKTSGDTEYPFSGSVEEEIDGIKYLIHVDDRPFKKKPFSSEEKLVGLLMPDPFT